jgi:hypothetical protein
LKKRALFLIHALISHFFTDEWFLSSKRGSDFTLMQAGIFAKSDEEADWKTSFWPLWLF